MARINVLVLCTGNSARSILGEALFNQHPRFSAHSAGSQPKGEPHPVALQTLTEAGHTTAGYRSKSWDEFAAEREGAPQFDVVITVCDSAAGESCPLWHGAPVRAQWSLPDPAAAPEAERKQAFKTIYAKLNQRIDRFASLPIDTLSPAALARELNAIGRMDDQ
ncbi:MAG: arsenate reductase ArsC [Pseudomonadota bacterium]